ncbi:MAG: hypothetical protein EA393_10645 [Bacteroidetes bacterium]|nr:MAG: hypothetical protein EA393_10645 [Bacteroidota bacterium]
MNRTFTFFLLLMLSAGLFAQNHFPLVTDHYHLELSFDYRNETLQGHCRMTIINQSDSAVTQIPLVLYRLMNVHSVKTDNGSELKFHQSVVQFQDRTKLQTNHIVVDYEIPPHESKVIHIDYGGHLLGYTETGWRYVTDRISPEFTLIRMDAYAYPIISQPSVSFLINNIMHHLFDYDIVVTVPDTLVVASGGRLQSRTPAADNQMTYHYSSKKPAWRIDIAIAPYSQLNTEVLNIFYLNDENSAMGIAESGANAMQQYTSWWGELLSPEAVTIIETERGSGGQADELVILLPEESFSNISNFHNLYHELAHLWHVFIRENEGISPRWEEGLADFSAYLLNETLFEERAGLLKRAANNNLGRLKRDFERNPSLTEIPMIDYGNHRITNLSYVQPMVMFTVLYYWLGEEVFHRAIGGFYQQYIETGASTKDFINYWKLMAPSVNLDGFFEDWIYTTRFAEFVMEEKSFEDILEYYKNYTH